jgi:excisionase family DNA binding protein
MAGKKAPQLFTRAEAAQILRRNTRSLDRLLAAGHPRSIRIGHRRLIPLQALQELAKTGTPNPVEFPNG